MTGSDPAVIRRVGQQRDWMLVFLFSLARTAFCAYRAATQSIAHDEAFTWDHFLTGPWSQIFARYDANNHILYSILRGQPPDSVKLSVSWWLQPALDFYRQHDHIAALQSIARNETTALDGFDYYVLDLRGDRTFPSFKVDRLRPLFSDPVSGVLLAKEPAGE